MTTFELVIRFVSPNRDQRLRDKQILCAWFERRGRTDYVEGVIDGVDDELSEREHLTAQVDELRLGEAPLALYDAKRAVLEEMQDLLKKRFGEGVTLVIHEIPESAWQSCWREDFQAWQSQRFDIVPLRDAANASDERHKMRLVIDDRGGAFGTGQHHTTRCLLGLIEANFEKWSVQSVLDVGAGTGILAIACGKLGAQQLVGTEIDQDLVTLAKENAFRNGVHLDIQLTSVPQFAKPFDLVIANILVPVLHDLMPQLARAVKAGGRMLLAGFIAKEAELILAKAQTQGLIVESTVDEGGWLGVVLIRPKN